MSPEEESPLTELEQVMARFLEDLELGRPVDEDALKKQYGHLEPDLSEFLLTHRRFLDASQAAKDEIQAAPPVESRPPKISHSPSSTTLGIPKQLGPYQIIEEIDRGGMGIVYKARHVSLDRIVALKLIRSGELASDEEVQRFNTEAAAAAALHHPGIVPIFEVGMLQGHYYYTMAYIEGQPLSEILKEGAVEKTRALKILNKLCQAVEHAHQHGIYHRDLKPANVLIDSDDQPIVIDFGLAKVSSRDSELTVTGQVLGTPAYMAPERAQGRATAGPAEDIYSLGALSYYLLSGQPPYIGPTPFDILLQVLDSEPPLPSQIATGLNKHIDHFCLKALRKNPAERYLRCSAMAEDAQRLLRGESINNDRQSIADKLVDWWNREPILVAHVAGIGATAAIIALTQWIAGGQTIPFTYRMILFAVWLAASFALQRWVRFAQHRDTAIRTWLSVDVILYTWLIAFAEPPRSMLLVGYPMMIVASSLYYRRRFVIYATVCCILGFLSLVLLFPHKTYEGIDIDEQYQGAGILEPYRGLDIDFFRYEYCAIFLTGLVVISLCLLSVIRRVRRLSIYYSEEN
jgi:eukaryotic-like serine/threonine-protein kinase